MNTAAIFLIVLLVFVIAACAAVYFSKKKGPPPPSCSGKRWRLAEPEEFYTITSSSTGNGRTTDGDYIRTPNNVVIEKGLTTRADLGKYLLTYAHGHPYYNPGSPGALTGDNWSDHALGFAPSLSICDALTGPGKVLVLEDGASAVLDGDAEYEGVVVRRGGILLVAGHASLRAAFVLVESGGLFQAGCSYKSSHRFDGRFVLTLTSPAQGGYATQGCPASQYSYKVYAPGVDTELSLPGGKKPVFAPYTGMTSVFGNSFGPKSLCGGFNGNIHLAGALGPLVDYKGTWNAFRGSDGTPVFDPDTDRLSVGVDWLPKSYAMTWAPLAPGTYAANTTSIKVSASGSDLQWWVGQEVVVLACPQTYTTETDATGLLPIWLNDSDQVQRSANTKANAQFLSEVSTRMPSAGGAPGSVPGVEVATVTAVKDDGTLVLADPLKFDHSAQQLRVTRSFGSSPEDIKVDTTPHVALLSRNILITSDFATPGGGCNVLYTGKATDFATGKFGATANTILENSGMQNMKIDDATAHQGGGGPGGSVLCNSDGKNANPSNEVYTTCYKDGVRTDPALYCGTTKPPAADSVPGHWLWGTAGQTGCGAIHGGQTMYRYGCAVRLDSVELKRMGTPGNFGTIAQYAVHFHLTGFAKAFRGYLPDKNYPREQVVANSSIWLSLSRWVTLHGTAEAELSNNVGFMTFGSGFFVEDGPEYLNIIDHNLGAYAIPAVQNSYLNPAPVFPSVSTDFSQMSVFWLKNNVNVVARNVAACCPSPVIGFWMVPQPIANLRGPSAVCLGSEELGLPGFASQGCAVGGSSPMGLSQNMNHNADGNLPSVAGKGAKTACWVPTDGSFRMPLVVATNSCMAYSTTNTENPYLGFMENVAYAIYMLVGEMPEMLAAGNIQYDFTTQGALGVTSQLQDNVPRPQWLPFNGQNSCTDKIVGIYTESSWTADLPYQPLSQDEINEASKSTASQSVGARLLPKIISGCLTFCTGAFQGLWGATGWIKGAPAWLINCAFLDLSPDGAKMAAPIAAPPGVGDVLDARLSTVFEQNFGIADNHGWNKYYPVFANFICNGCISAVANPSLWIGERTFFADRVVFGSTMEEYANSGLSSTAKWFCDFGSSKRLDDIFPMPMELGINAKASSQCPNSQCPPVTIYLYDLNAKELARVTSNGKPGSVSWKAEATPPPGGAGQAKFPFVCKKDGLRRPSDGRDPDFNQKYGLGDATANLTTRHFFTQGAQDIGDRICEGLSQIPPNLDTTDWPSS